MAAVTQQCSRAFVYASAFLTLILLAWTNSSSTSRWFLANTACVLDKNMTLAATAATAVQSEQHNTNNGNEDDDELLVDYGDSIYLWGDWDGSPVVLEQYKLIFFTSAKVGCTVWKQLFRRMMGYQADWNKETYDPSFLPWNPQTNGLSYLYDYSRQEATHMMTSPDWTRAIVVRDAKERFISAYLDKAVSHETYLRDKCCYYKGDCVESARKSPEGFLKLIQKCDDAHWRPQSVRMQEKYWPYINFVGHMDSVAQDAERLLKQIGAWEEYGATGWGSDGNSSIFQTKAGGGGRKHATNAHEKLKAYISPELEKRLDYFYRNDYSSPYLNMTKWKLHG